MKFDVQPYYVLRGGRYIKVLPEPAEVYFPATFEAKSNKKTAINTQVNKAINTIYRIRRCGSKERRLTQCVLKTDVDFALYKLSIMEGLSSRGIANQCNISGKYGFVIGYQQINVMVNRLKERINKT
jgi:hypothetical protein